MPVDCSTIIKENEGTYIGELILINQDISLIIFHPFESKVIPKMRRDDKYLTNYRELKRKSTACYWSNKLKALPDFEGIIEYIHFGRNAIVRVIVERPSLMSICQI